MDKVEDLVAALEKIKALLMDWNGPVHEAWDSARALLIEGNRGSLPRDVLEGGISDVWEVADDAIRAWKLVPVSPPSPDAEALAGRLEDWADKLDRSGEIAMRNPEREGATPRVSDLIFKRDDLRQATALIRGSGR